MDIKQISATTSLQGKTSVFGLGSDNKIYMWSSDREEWVKAARALPPTPSKLRSEMNRIKPKKGKK